MFIKLTLSGAIERMYRMHKNTNMKTNMRAWIGSLVYEVLYVQLFGRAILANFLSPAYLHDFDYSNYFLLTKLMNSNRIVYFSFTVLLIYPLLIEYFMTFCFFHVFESLFDDVYHMIGMIKKNSIDGPKMGAAIRWLPFRRGFFQKLSTQSLVLAENFEILTIKKLDKKYKRCFIFLYKIFDFFYTFFAILTCK